MCQTIKNKLIERFNFCRSKLGKKWKQELASHDEYFKTYEGFTSLQSASGVNTRPEGIHVERLNVIVESLEKICELKK